MSRYLLSLLLATGFASNAMAANLLIDAGDFSSGTVVDQGPSITPAQIDQGWFGDRGPGYQIGGGIMTTPETRSSLVQVNNLTTLSLSASELAATQLNLSFEWTAPTSGSYFDINYVVVGWRGTSTPFAEDSLFKTLNQAVNTTLDNDLNGTIFGINSGALVTEGSAAPSTTVSGSQSVSTTFNLESMLTLGDYDYIGVRFFTDISAADGEATIDDLYLTAAPIPEPSRAALLCVGVVAGCLTRRRRAR